MKFEITGNEVLGISENGKKVASVSFEKTGDGIYNIYHTYVDESMRGKGVASDMIEYTVKHLKSIGAVKVHATCSFAQCWLEKNKI